MTPDQHARILELHAGGRSTREIAADVGLSHVTVYKVLKAVNTPPVNPSEVNTPRAVYNDKGEVLWPSWEATGEVRVGLSGTRYDVMKPMPPRPARRANPSKD